MTNTQLRDQAVAALADELVALKKTTRGLSGYKVTSTSQWGLALAAGTKALGLLAQITDVPVQPPPVGTNPVPPPAAGCYLGAYIEGRTTYGNLYPTLAPWSNAPIVDPGTSDAWPQFEKNAGKKVALLMFGQSNWMNTPLPKAGLDAVHARGAIPVLDVMTDTIPLSDIIAGRYDTQIAARAAEAAGLGYPFVLRWNPEMNGAWYGYGLQARANPALYVSAWRHTHDLFTAAGAANVAWHWCPQADVMDPGWPLTPLESCYPGDLYVDWLGMTDYSHATNELFDWLFAGTYLRLMALAPGKPIMIGEIASVAASRVAFLTDLFTKLPVSYPNVRGLCWFNWYNADGKVVPEEWPIESAALAQFQAGIASPYYVGRP